MKIWGNGTKVYGIDNKAKNIPRVDKSSSVTSSKDVVSISSNAKDFQTVLKTLRDVPDVRPEKVKELSEKYESGNYNVEGRTMAEKLLSSTVNRRV